MCGKRFFVLRQCSIFLSCLRQRVVALRMSYPDNISFLEGFCLVIDITALLPDYSFDLVVSIAENTHMACVREAFGLSGRSIIYLIKL